ncbi:MAG TPA: class I SAM-dependent methyltransferase [Candidatus Methylomirabilis sp.]|nr:class I SAM-dependent methyltransferase [Candidatus Methylomirabilis sp.]
MSSALLEKILAESPGFHCGDTETTQAFSEQSSSLRGAIVQNILNKVPACYGIDPALARFLFDSVSEKSRTLETGSGISTLVFALRGAKHIAVTPSADEAANIRKYAAKNGISMETVEFVIEPSDQYLPHCQAVDLDLVLIDGKHAFPWPILDWFFTADKLRQKGLMVLDDLQMSSVSMLGDFLREDPRWEVEREFGRRTLVMRKKASGSVNDVSWHMQPYITRRYGRKARLFNALGIRHGPKADKVYKRHST